MTFLPLEYKSNVSANDDDQVGANASDRHSHNTTTASFSPLLLVERNNARQNNDNDVDDDDVRSTVECDGQYRHLNWHKVLVSEWGERLIVNEFDEPDINGDNSSNDTKNYSNTSDDDKTKNSNDNYRNANGWKGRDLIHSRHSPVRISSYYIIYGTGSGLSSLFHIGGIGTRLCGIVQFTNRAESHKGYCHGGSMCSVMDDIIGWCGFQVSGKCLPWSGYTVQINTRLQKPIQVNSILPVQATITNIERRKIYINATIWDPTISITPEDTSIHATCEGIFVVNKDIL